MCLVAIATIGLGLVAAPFIFQMWSRAPKGAVMLDEFRPFMTQERIDGFQGYMDEIQAAVDETSDSITPYLEEQAGLDPAQFDAEFASFASFAQEWPGVNADMTDLLAKVDRSIDNYEAVDALPPFDLFPWFFVLPGLLAAGFAITALVKPGALGRGVTWAVFGLGLGLIAAPFVFQMFDRAPKGAEMMDDFTTLMTRERVQTVQGYFATMAVGQGSLRLDLIPAVQAAGGLDEHELAEQFPAVTTLNDHWIVIINDMTPMIGAMSDNVDNYDALQALPPFDLFPWFFVLPGLLFVGLALVALRRPKVSSAAASAAAAAPTERTPPIMANHSSADASLGNLRSRRSRRWVVVSSLLALALVVSACGGDDDDSSSSSSAPSDSSATDDTAAAGPEELVGTFELDAGTCDATTITGGSYLRMVLAGGTLEDGAFFENPDSECSDRTYITITPGADGGVVSGEFQPVPDPAFDGTGNSLADAITRPQGFVGIQFSISSNETDPQTGETAPAPSFVVEDGVITGDTSAITASWNNEYFNQGAPKPDGSEPGLTRAVTGTYDADTGKFVIEWSSQVVGGPFNDFTGIWHLEGTFTPAEA